MRDFIADGAEQFAQRSTQRMIFALGHHIGSRRHEVRRNAEGRTDPRLALYQNPGFVYAHLCAQRSELCVNESGEGSSGLVMAML